MEALTIFFQANSVSILMTLSMVVAFLLLLTLILLIVVGKQKSKLSLFMRGSEAKNFEETVKDTYDRVKELELDRRIEEVELDRMKKILAGSFQRCGTVYYNAFSGMGGNTSCACALLTVSLDGIILNVVHGRENCYTYIKTVHGGKPDVVLGKEEQEALELALDSKPLDLSK